MSEPRSDYGPPSPWVVCDEYDGPHLLNDGGYACLNPRPDPTCVACDGTGVLRTNGWDEEGFPCPECGGVDRFPVNDAGHACRRDAIVDGICIDCERPPKADQSGRKAQHERR